MRGGEEQPPPARVVLAAACLGRLGQWGNQAFQYAAVKLAAELHGLHLQCPDWPGRAVLACAAQDALLTDDAAAALPLCADRPVLSHAGWRAWASAREPLASALAGGDSPSGRQVRRLMPQVNADVLCRSDGSTPNDPGVCAAALSRSHAWWGWFQFHTSAYVPHRRRFCELFEPAPRAGAALAAALARLRHGGGGGDGTAPRQLLGIHVRRGEGFTPLNAGDAAAAAPAEAPAEAPAAAPWAPPERGGMDAAACTTGAWRDTGVFWAPPLEWYVTWLQRTLAAWPTAPPPLVLLCSNASADATAPLAALGARTLAEALGAEAHAALADALGGGADGAALADWFVLSSCDALAVSNSTFSFSAAMLAAERAARAAPAVALLFTASRPDPAARALVPFDPWDAAPTLKLGADDCR